MHEHRSFADGLGPAPKEGGFRKDDWVIWGTSVVEGEDGDYHAFASGWSADVSFGCWTTNSHVIRGTAPTPKGPFEFRDIVVPPGSEGAWDRMSHNPSIVRAPDGTYLLYYYGCNFEGARPTPNRPEPQPRTDCAVGLATADSVAGPWEMHGQISGGTNPVPVVRDDGSVLLYTRDGSYEVSVWEADHYAGEYEMLAENVFRPVEDHYVWRAPDGEFHMVAKDMHIHVDDHEGYAESYAGIHATSPDGLDWTVSDPPHAYPHRVEGDRDLVIEWDDGTETRYPNVERAQVLVEDGIPTHLYLAVLEPGAQARAEAESLAELPSHTADPEAVFNVCLPIESPPE
ncbi:MAG: glycoside hydrolase family protein [Halobacteriaceae archaeon]